MASIKVSNSSNSSKKKTYLNTPINTELFNEFKKKVIDKKLSLNTVLELFMNDIVDGSIDIKFEKNDDDIVVPKLRFNGD